MADEQDEQQKKEIYGHFGSSAELEEGAAQMAESFACNAWHIDKATAVLLCSIAISLKKLAEEANSATANMYQGQMK